MSAPAKLHVKVTPKSSRNAVLGWLGDVLKLSVTAVPEHGKANKAVIELLAKELKLAPSKLAIASGHGNARKILSITDLTEAELKARLTLIIQT